MINREFLKRRWLDFRNGHSTYLVFAMAFFQFTVVTYTLAIERLPLLKDLFPSMSHWLAFFVLVYIPAAVIVGHLHLKKQIPTEAKQLTMNNPYTFQATPGKELLYNLPATVIGYDLQLKAMNIHNQTAEFYKRTFGFEIEKWDKADFAHIEKLKEIAVRLQKGESINDIVKP